MRFSPIGSWVWNPALPSPPESREPPTPPITSDNVDELVEWMFAPWVRAQGHEVPEVDEGRVVTRHPAAPEQVHVAGTLCGQAIMSGVDTAMA